jgi:hypothetical protein
MNCYSLLQKYGSLLLLLLLIAVTIPHQAAGEKLDEYQIKAGFVLNFAMLTEWPADSPVDKDSFSIAILGKTPSNTFVNTLKSMLFHGIKVTVRHADSVEEAKNCRLIFISASERNHLSGILRDLQHQNVLTVSDMNGFCEAGGMIGLVQVQNRIGYEVNLAAVRKAHLSISSQMLKLAKKVYGN